MIEFVAATRLTELAFPTSPLGVSLSRIAHNPALRATIFYENTRGLAELYNQRIEAEASADILVFAHDDIWIEDFYVTDRIMSALASFDIVGLAGSRRRVPHQRIWAREPDREDRLSSHLAGAIAHGDHPLGVVGFFGPIVAPVELLDGVLLAARKSALLEGGVRFDPRFDFHFYDLDFCRTARQSGLRLGTFPLAVTHRSQGSFGSPAWHTAAERYFAKWKE